MRVVHVLESTATGTLSMVQIMANRLAAERHEVIVIYSRRKDTPQELGRMFRTGVELRHLQMRGRPLPAVIAALRKEIAIARPDVVHLHSSFAGFLGRISTAFLSSRTRYFYSPHCISFMRADVPMALKLAFAGLEWLASWKKCTYVGCSMSECDAVRRYLGKRVVLLENAVDISDLSSSGMAMEQRPMLRVVTAGGLRRQKDPLKFAAIARRFDRDSVEFVWLGDGDDSFKQALRDAAVTVTGWLPRADVIAQIGKADLYLSTSAWEGMPVSVIEAMAVGTPVLATRCSGNTDVIRHDETGWLFDTENEASGLIERICIDAALRRRIAQAAQKEAGLRFSEDRFYTAVRELYSIPAILVPVPGA
jgi:glycosyltransferase involved in cell wall biosynthesis